MSDIKLPYGRQEIHDEDIQAVTEVLRSDWLTMGPAVESFERAVAEYIGTAHAVSFSSGTAALHGAMAAAGVGPGDSVVLPPLTFAATGNSVVYCGGRPVFADISPDTLCLDAEAALKACDSCPGKVRAIAAVSFAGYPVDIASLKRAAYERETLLIEDAAHALGAVRDGRKVGCDADMTVFSFHPVKHITTGEGGMVVTDSPLLAKRMKRFRSHGLVREEDDFVREYRGGWDNDIIEIGYNYRLSDISAALGESQLRRMDHNVARRREIAALYRRELDCLKSLLLPPDNEGHAWHLFPIWVNPGIRDAVFSTLRSNGVGTQVHYVPLHLHTYYRRTFGTAEGDCPHAERYSSGVLSLPMFPALRDEDVLYVSSLLKGLLEGEEAISW